ncbi:WXG100 family type VII secretion target [Streptomyces prunicolor]|uniref:WXG100 family type VII secretion target n=1 Tax=Streptomyces prunicolor TaxID=67348 RepID=UPI0033D8E860
MSTNGQPYVTAGGVTYRVTPHYLASAAANCTKTAGDLDVLLASIRSYVLSLEAVWQGIAQQQFDALMLDYDTFARMLHDALTGIAGGLNGNYVNYTESEQANINNLVRINGDIPGGGKLANFS